MEFAIAMIQKIPAGWPRLALLAAILIAYFLFPDLVKNLSRGRRDKEALETLTRFLQIKKLLFEIQAFQKEKNLSGFEFPGESRLLAELNESTTAVEESKEKITYLSRLKYSMKGAAVFFLVAALLFCFRSSSRDDHPGDSKVSSAGFGFLRRLRVPGFRYPVGSSAYEFSLRIDDAFGRYTLVFDCEALGKSDAQR